MGHIYCLYGTDELSPRYVGLSAQDRGRAEQHYAAAADGDAKPVYRWMRTVFLAGHEVHVHIIEDNVMPRDLREREGYWMTVFPGLTNVQGYSLGRRRGGRGSGAQRSSLLTSQDAAGLGAGGFAGLAEPPALYDANLEDDAGAVAARLRASTRVSCNHRGTIGLIRERDARAYRMRVSFGRADGRCWSGCLKGETLAGFEERGPVWFRSRARAIAARDAERARIESDPLFRAYCGDGWSWPADHIEDGDVND